MNLTSMDPNPLDLTSKSSDQAHSSQRTFADSKPGEQFLRRVRAAAVNVLGNGAAGRAVEALCDDHHEARQMILQDRSGGASVIAVVGATGQGKSWLIRQLVRDSQVAGSIRSGNNADEATEKLLWIGPHPPADLDTRHEKFLHCESSKMQSIGTPYLLVDSPGSTDDRRSIAAVASRALSLASVILLVVRRDQLRSEAVGMLAEASEGTLVVPVINAVRQKDDRLGADIDAFVSHMREIAPTSIIVSPVIIDDFEVASRSETEVSRQATESIAARLSEELGLSWEGDRRRSVRLAALDGRFRAALHSVLSDQLPGLTSAVTRLNDEATKLPGEVAETLIGAGGPLRAAVRSRLRLSLLTDTAAIWFPFRSLLGMLNLTHGAWDRVLLSLSGSLPSLVGTVWTTTKNLASTRDAQQDVRDGLRQRSAAAVTDRLEPLAHRFRDEIASLRSSNTSRRERESRIDDGSRSRVAFLAGIDALQEKSQNIFESEVQRVSMTRGSATVCAVIGTAIFWFLMAGPIVALYRQYFDASYTTLRDFSGDLDAFPKPDFSMMLTSLIVSILPTSLFAMLILSVAQSRSRVDRAESRIRSMHEESIHQLQKDGVLRLQWDDPLLADAEFLLSAGDGDWTEPS
tara:strand:- start:146160 stop:148055 length:1896 start_codon:yes stop_codon:yes gene_type:complete